jgi:HAD superfamily hydrolase (TIGR01509 family)
MPQAAIFDIDGTLVDSVDLHALAWQEAFAQFGKQVTFQQVRGQIGKGGDQLMPAFLSPTEADQIGQELEAWRSRHFKTRFLPMVRPFAAAPDLLRRAREAGLRIAVASSAKQQELDAYLDIAGIRDLVDIATSSDDAARSKPAPDIFQAALAKLDLPADHTVAIGDSPYDAQAARAAGIPVIGVLSGGFNEADLLQAGCAEVYPSPAALFACFGASLLGK